MYHCPYCGSDESKQQRKQPARYEYATDKHGHVNYRYLARVCRQCNEKYWVRQSSLDDEAWESQDAENSMIISEEEYLGAKAPMGKVWVGVFVGDYTKRVSRGYQPSFSKDRDRSQLRQWSPN